MKPLKTLMLASAVLAFPACSQADPVSTTDKAAIESIVYDYLMENPEVIREALIALEAKQDAESIAAVKSAIYNEKRDVVVGPKNAKITIVEFFDYNCGYCKRSTNWLVKTIKENPNDVRVIFKELPMLDGRTKTSKTAAKAALAAARQDKYLEMHQGLMELRVMTDDRIDETAKKVGIDVDLMRQDMSDPTIIQHVEDTLVLGQRLRPLTGTPFFMIGDEFYAGANIERLEEMLETARKS